MYDDYFLKAYELTRAGQPFATATVVRAEKPTSAQPGDRAIITPDGSMYGWVGGSCAQPTVVREALEAISTDQARLIRLSPDQGSEELPPGYQEVPMTCFSGGTLDVYIEPQQPRPRLVVVGDLSVARSLVELGRAMSYHVVAVASAGDAHASPADEVVTDLDQLPGRVTPFSFVVVATHGPGDAPALALALTTDAPYVGLVASRKRGEEVLRQVRESGLDEEVVARVRVPAGLDIQARRGDEIALSIMAEIIQVRRNLEGIEWAGDPETTSCCEGQFEP